MSKVHFTLAMLAMFVLFSLEGPVVDMLGWAYVSPSASAITKIHPSTYLFAFAAGLVIIDRTIPRIRLDPVVTSWQFMFYVLAVLALLVRAVQIASSSLETAGEQSAATVTWVTPIFAIISIAHLRPKQLASATLLLRAFFVGNSLMALAEAATGTRVFLGYVLENGLQGRATALTAHPLSGAILTGIMIIMLAFGPGRGFPKFLRLPELLLHGMAMFAFGGRASLVFMVATLIAGGLLVHRRAGEDKVGVFQRLLPLAIILVAILVVAFPPEIVSNVLNRFNFGNDKSAATRFALSDIFSVFNNYQMLWGMNNYQLHKVLIDNKSPLGIEAAWLQMVAVFGAVVTVPLALAFVLLLGRIARRIDRSGPWVIFFFLAVTATSLSIGSKSLLVSQLVAILLVIGDRPSRLRPRGAVQQPQASVPRDELAIPSERASISFYSSRG